MIKHFRLYPFVFGIIIGIISIYFVTPKKEVIHRYPTPDNTGKLTYKDKNGICYKYNAITVDCDKNESRLRDFPLNK
jgi:hypothetical protein